MHFLEGLQDKDTASVLRGSYAVLIVEGVVPKRLELSLLPRFGLSRDRWVIFVEGGVVLVKRDRHPGLVLVSRVRKEEDDEFSSFRAGEANRETCLKEDLSYSLEVVVLWLDDDWGESLDGGFEFGGDVG